MWSAVWIFVTYGKDWLVKAWPYVLALGALAQALYGLVTAAIESLLGSADAISAIEALTTSVENSTSTLHALPIHSVMGYVNRVFPVTELLGFFALYFALILAVLFIRLVIKIVQFIVGG